MNKVLGLILGTFLAFAVQAEDATPFGFVMGTPIKEIDSHARKITNSYQYVVTPPNGPTKAFDTFIVQAAPKAGLCWMIASTKPIPVSDGRGEELVEVHHGVMKVLAEQYGDPTDVVMLETEDNPFKKPNQFMLSLMMQDRTIYYMWDVKRGATLPDNLTKVAVHLMAPDDLESGRVAVEYSFTNEKNCDLEVLDQTSQLN